jgi:hypothetical protein
MPRGFAFVQFTPAPPAQHCQCVDEQNSPHDRVAGHGRSLLGQNTAQGTDVAQRGEDEEQARAQQPHRADQQGAAGPGHRAEPATAQRTDRLDAERHEEVRGIRAAEQPLRRDGLPHARGVHVACGDLEALDEERVKAGGDLSESQDSRLDTVGA